MKLFFILSTIATILLSNSECNSKKSTSGILKGRLEIKGICYNYTIKLIDGNIDTSALSTEWTDPNTGKSYTNVFGLSEPCSFPESLKEGETFEFTINTAAVIPCVVCNAYYPAPPRSLNIKVLKK